MSDRVFTNDDAARLALWHSREEEPFEAYVCRLEDALAARTAERRAASGRADYWSRQAAYWEEVARSEARRTHEWRGRAMYLCGALVFVLGAYRGADWILALGVVVVAATVAIQQRGGR